MRAVHASAVPDGENEGDEDKSARDFRSDGAGQISPIRRAGRYRGARRRGIERSGECSIERRGSTRQFSEPCSPDHRLDLLINNAGIGRIGQDDRRLSADGQELHFAINYLAGYLLTRMLLPRLVSSAPSRIINVSSRSQLPIDFDDITVEKGYSFQRGYGRSKLAQIMFAIDLAAEFEGTGVTSYSVHPASAMNTNMLLEAGARCSGVFHSGQPELGEPRFLSARGR